MEDQQRRKGGYNPESGRWRWKLPDGSILEWDKQHGRVERYDRSGNNHEGEYDPNTGEEIEGKRDPKRWTPKMNPVQEWNPSYQPLTPPSSNNGTRQIVTTVATGVVVGYIALKVVEGVATVLSGGSLGWTLAF